MTMAYSGLMDDVRRCVRGEVPKQLPVFACGEEMDVRVSGYTYEQFATDAKIMADVAIKAVKRFDYDWVWLQVDDCILVELLGVGVKGSGNILRATTTYLPASRETLAHLPRPNVKKDGRCAVLLEAIKRCKDEFGDTVCVVGRMEGPFSSVGLLYGLDATMMLTITDPQLVLDTEKAFVEMQTAFGLAQFEAGADAVWFGDCNASTHLMSAKTFRDLAAEPARQVIKEFTKAGGLTFMHNSEERADGWKAQSEIGPSALSVGPGGNIFEARKVVGPKQCLLGNVDPIKVLERGTPADVERQVREIVSKLSIHGAHLLNSGEMVPRDTPEANIEAMIATARTTWKELTAKRASK
jgi:MtaA/CmuA family methyltransferase